MNGIGQLRKLTSLALIGLLGVVPMAAQDQAPLVAQNDVAHAAHDLQDQAIAAGLQGGQLIHGRQPYA